LARALINEPLVVLADEPTGNLDSHATNEILRLFAELRDTQQTLVLVTHDSRFGATAERLITMHDGTIVDDTRLDGGQHLAACLLACAVGIPLGIALYNAIRGATLDPIDLTPLTYIAVCLTALLLYAVIALTPARLLARRPVTPQLAYE
jgi:energy-coupling factor transporter ATP-binding protein EcfA2